MAPNSSMPRILQQQQPRPGDPQQQQSGSNEFQPKPKPKSKPQAQAQQGDQQMGEGSYEATRDYNQRIAEYLKKADVEADAEKAKPRSEDEARDLRQAEDEGRSHSKGER